jgi:hypothetical protein
LSNITVHSIQGLWLEKNVSFFQDTCLSSSYIFNILNIWDYKCNKWLFGNLKLQLNALIMTVRTTLRNSVHCQTMINDGDSSIVPDSSKSYQTWPCLPNLAYAYSHQTTYHNAASPYHTTSHVTSSSNNTPHRIAHHFTTPHYTRHCTALYRTSPHHTSPHPTSRSTTLHLFTLHRTTQHRTSLHRTISHLTTPHCNKTHRMHHITPHHTTIQYH